MAAYGLANDPANRGGSRNETAKHPGSYIASHTANHLPGDGRCEAPRNSRGWIMLDSENVGGHLEHRHGTATDLAIYPAIHLAIHVLHLRLASEF